MSHTTKTFLFGGILVSFIGCMEIHPITLPPDPSAPTGGNTPVLTPCLPKPIEKNIIGNWRFKTLNPQYPIRTGAITFTDQKNIIDPDSLFTNRLDIGDLVTAKTYNPSALDPAPASSRRLFAVYQTTKKGTQILYYSVVINECNKIRLAYGNREELGFELTR